jgi:hypothetical protein
MLDEPLMDSVSFAPVSDLYAEHRKAAIPLQEAGRDIQGIGTSHKALGFKVNEGNAATWREYGIRLAVAPKVSNLDQAHGLRLGTLDLPGLGSRKASTEVTLESGQALVMSGLIQEGEDEVVDRVPLLGDLPFVGALFRHRRSERQRTELTIVVTPRVLEIEQP